MIALVAILLATEPVPVITNPRAIELVDTDKVGLDWDCERDSGSDKLTLGKLSGVPNFTRTLANQKPAIVVDCAAETTSYGKDYLLMEGGFCQTYWAVKITLKPSNPDQAIADLQIGKQKLDGYSCARRGAGEKS